MNNDWLQKLSPETRNAMQMLENTLKQMPRVAVAYSGGMDSTLLAIVTRHFKADASQIILVDSEFMSRAELETARNSSKACGLNHREIHINLLENHIIKQNPKNRCYHCKQKIFSCLINAVEKKAILCDGSVIDDQSDYRPGRQALAELGIRSPLAESGFDKSMVAETLTVMGCPSIIRPGQSCLATRIPIDTRIESEDLKRIEAGEKFLTECGFSNARLRLHGNLARIELDSLQIHRGIDILQQLTDSFKKLGFKYICLDLNGYQRGSMN